MYNGFRTTLFGNSYLAEIKHILEDLGYIYDQDLYRTSEEGHPILGYTKESIVAFLHLKQPFVPQDQHCLYEISVSHVFDKAMQTPEEEIYERITSATKEIFTTMLEATRRRQHFLKRLAGRDREAIYRHAMEVSEQIKTGTRDPKLDDY